MSGEKSAFRLVPTGMNREGELRILPRAIMYDAQALPRFRTMRDPVLGWVKTAVEITHFVWEQLVGNPHLARKIGVRGRKALSGQVVGPCDQREAIQLQQRCMSSIIWMACACEELKLQEKEDFDTIAQTVIQYVGPLHHGTSGSFNAWLRIESSVWSSSSTEVVDTVGCCGVVLQPPVLPTASTC